MRNKRVATVVVSAGAALLVGASGALAASPPSSLSGHGHGTWSVTPSNPDTGKQHVLKGHGQFTIGAARIRGSITSPGFIANGDCTVSLRLVTSTGKLVLAGHTPRSSSSYPTCVGAPYRFHFHTTKASGDLAGASYKGIGHFDLENASSSSTDNGTFTLKLKPLT
ncbi:MAG: hypothetical protein ACTHK4_01650 [Mycobacteriales bacterium]